MNLRWPRRCERVWCVPSMATNFILERPSFVTSFNISTSKCIKDCNKCTIDFCGRMLLYFRIHHWTLGGLQNTSWSYFSCVKSTRTFLSDPTDFVQWGVVLKEWKNIALKEAHSLKSIRYVSCLRSFLFLSGLSPEVMKWNDEFIDNCSILDMSLARYNAFNWLCTMLRRDDYEGDTTTQRRGDRLLEFDTYQLLELLAASFLHTRSANRTLCQVCQSDSSWWEPHWILLPMLTLLTIRLWFFWFFDQSIYFYHLNIMISSVNIYEFCYFTSSVIFYSHHFTNKS